MRYPRNLILSTLDGAAQENFEFTFASGFPLIIKTLVVGQIIVVVYMAIEETFSIGTKLFMGFSADNEKIVAKKDVRPERIGGYSVTSLYKSPGGETLTLYKEGSPSQGKGFCIVEFSA